MHGKTYHKMPVSSWMIPGGNREQKEKLIKEKKYPMKSAIQRNLNGPLSEVFFANLTPVQQDHIGYTPKLQGPGENLWVSPSDVLMGHVVLKPPYTSKIKQALTHHGILEIGGLIEEKVIRAHKIEMKTAVKKKEQEMKKQAAKVLKKAIDADRIAHAKIARYLLQTAQKHLTKSYQDILTSTIDEITKDAVQRMEEAVRHTQQELEQELCDAVESHRQYLGKQYELQVSWLHNQLSEKFENILKKQGQKCSMELEEIQRQCEFEVQQNSTHIQAEHVTDLVVQACEKSQIHHEEKVHLEQNFGTWFVSNLNSEIVNRDFKILELEDAIRKLKAQGQRREQQFKDIIRHFQKFINCALHEKPGQAEFLLSLETEMKSLCTEVKTDEEVELICTTILDYIIKSITEKAVVGTQNEEQNDEEMTLENFREKISADRSKNRLLTLVGEHGSNHKKKQSRASDRRSLPNNQLKESLFNLLYQNPSVLKMIHSVHEQEEVMCEVNLEPNNKT